MEATAADVRLARMEFDGAGQWLAALRDGASEPLAAEVWVFDEGLGQVLLVRHRLRGWVPPGGRVEPGETPREGARRELFEETGVAARLLADPAAATIRSYHPDLPPTLGLSYMAIVDAAASLSPEHGQPAAWISLDQHWDSCFPEDPPRIRRHAQWLRDTAAR
ncbi:DNA mismatch repair protein MutT [Streptomyces mangrovisoli]|uniref:DNA mismatch repair protein MutT n=2 Tax=Streptomyces mangrovisoli TaxID=1428628 RepID=A0A1J4NVP3_9ACTN|nr:DNA mismatch repair protein MutT [Streptomyces mangrovisoli]